MFQVQATAGCWLWQSVWRRQRCRLETYGYNSLHFTRCGGCAEIAGVENAGVEKTAKDYTGGGKRERKKRHQVAGVKKAGVEKAAQNIRGGKRGNGKRGTK